MIRLAEKTDWPILHEIVSDVIRTSHANLSWQPESLESFIEFHEKTMKDYPILVAQVDGQVLGYGYTHRWLEKDAYQFIAELTMYFAPGNHHGQTALLLAALEKISAAQNIRWLISCTTASNRNSQAFQTRHGFVPFGYFPQAGFKEGVWHDVCWYRKELRPDNEDSSQHFVPFSQIKWS